MEHEDKIKLYLIEGGLPLQMVKDHIADKERAHQMRLHILTQLGFDPSTTQVWYSAYDGGLSGVLIPKQKPRTFVNANWTKADNNGKRRPKKGTDEFKILFSKDAQWRPAEQVIGLAYNVPGQINWRADGGSGCTAIGRMMNACGFLWMDKIAGPYAMWIPDIDAIVKAYKADHADYKNFRIENDVESWKMNEEGLKPLMQEEWDLLVAQKRLEEAKAKKQEEEQTA